MFIATCQALLQESFPNTLLTYIRGHRCLHAEMFAYFLPSLNAKSDCEAAVAAAAAACFLFPMEGLRSVTMKVIFGLKT